MGEFVYLLGNGFDLYHHFPTQYSDFLATVYYLSSIKSRSKLKTVGDAFSKVARKNKHICECYKHYKEEYDAVTLDKDTVTFLAQKARSNMWFNYLYYSFNKDVNWIDFEKEIGNVIDVFDEFFETCEKNNTITLNDDVKDLFYVLKRFGFFFRKDEEEKLVSKTEVDGLTFAAFSIHNTYFIDDKFLEEWPYGSGVKYVNKEKIVKRLFDELVELAEMLKHYLALFVDKVTEHLLATKQGVNGFDSKYVISFNYTHTYELLYGKNQPEVAHIHGECDIGNSIVLGVNPDRFDEKEGFDASFLQFKKYFQRLFYNTDTSYIDLVKKLKKCNAQKNDFTLIVFGHSLDTTDQDIIKELFEMAGEIIIYYPEHIGTAQLIKNLVAIFQKDKLENMRAEKRLWFMPVQNVSWKEAVKAAN